VKLVSMLDEELLLEKIPGSSKSDIYKYMLEKLSGYVELELDVPSLTQTMLGQSYMHSMPVPGLDMPHVREESLPDLFIVIGLPENPSAVGADMVFMSLIGKDMSDVYLKVISTLARHLTVPGNSEKLIASARNGSSALWNYLQDGDITLRTVVTAKDVMSPATVFLRDDMPLSEAFDLFCTTHRRFLPVVDASGHFKGELSSRAVVKSFFPDYVFMMENLNFLNDFAVFNEIFHSEHALRVAEYLNPAPATATLDTPLIQLTLLLTKQDAGDVYVVDKDNMLCGTFGIDNVISKVLRG